MDRCCGANSQHNTVDGAAFVTPAFVFRAMPTGEARSRNGLALPGDGALLHQVIPDLRIARLIQR
jgi:hypothetical protein